MQKAKVYRILMDERWELEDLYGFSHAYSQNHSFIYCFDTKLNPKDSNRINTALHQYPWNGGHSYVNFYTVLHNQIPKEYRPKIASIHYASPGWIDILLNPDVAIQIAESVGVLLGCGIAAVEAFKKIDKQRLEIAKQRKRHNRDMLKLSAQEAESLNKMSEEISKNLGFKNLQTLQQRTQNPEVTLKILMAHHRRLNALGEYVKDGKASLPKKLKNES